MHAPHTAHRVILSIRHELIMHRGKSIGESVYAIMLILQILFININYMFAVRVHIRCIYDESLIAAILFLRYTALTLKLNGSTNVSYPLS